MNINTQRINTKLNALLSKNVDTIVLAKCYIPSLGNKYSKANLNAWIKKFTTKARKPTVFSRGSMSDNIITYDTHR